MSEYGSIVTDTAGRQHFSDRTGIERANDVIEASRYVMKRQRIREERIRQDRAWTWVWLAGWLVLVAGSLLPWP